MENIKTFSLAIVMLINFATVAQENTAQDTLRIKGLQVQNGEAHKGRRIVFRCGAPKAIKNHPLLVLDNHIISAQTLQILDPKIIGSINILKGTQGAALFGEEGVNGVIIIKTNDLTARERRNLAAILEADQKNKK